MASCDLVVVRRDVTFALTEVRIGVAAAIISVPIFRRVNPRTSPPPFLTGEPFDAEHARDVGLVTHVTDDVTAVVDHAVRRRSRCGAPGAVAATKRMLRAAVERRCAPGRPPSPQMRALSDRALPERRGRRGHGRLRREAAAVVAAVVTCDARRLPPREQHYLRRP